MSQPSPIGGPAARWIRTNQGIAACIAVVALALLVYLATSDWTFTILRDGFRLGFFTAVSVIAMLICAVAMMIDRHRHEVDLEIAALRASDWGVAIVALALCYLYFVLAWKIGFLLVTPVFMAGATYAFGIRPVSTAIIAGVLTTAMVYALFRLIGIELPSQIMDHIMAWVG